MRLGTTEMLQLCVDNQDTMEVSLLILMNKHQLSIYSTVISVPHPLQVNAGNNAKTLDVLCYGNESKLSECKHVWTGCVSGTQAGVMCTGKSYHVGS